MVKYPILTVSRPFESGSASSVPKVAKKALAQAPMPTWCLLDQSPSAGLLVRCRQPRGRHI